MLNFSTTTSSQDKTLSSDNPFFLVADKPLQTIEPHHLAQAQRGLHEQGWTLFRGFKHDLDCFSQLVSNFCQQLTFDPAREFSSHMSQKVDAGILPVGLHIENGNTPFPPDIVAFYSQKSALTGSQTTVCDGVALFNTLPTYLQSRFSAPVTVSRTLPEHLWKSYVANEHPDLSTGQEVTIKHLNDVINRVPGQSGKLNDQGELDYCLIISPLLKKNGKTAFANALLGPSFNYQAPRYHFADGTKVTQEELDLLAAYAKAHTFELNWQDGDMILIDNTRIMHGRRAIEGDPTQRQLVIAMGRN
jgi:alpha-ketoglutarate-dependent taurine dioxygenase